MPITTRGSFIAPCPAAEPLADMRQQLVADGAVGIELLLAAALDRRRIGCLPVLNLGGERPRHFQRLVMRTRRERHDDIEIEPLQLVQILERVGAVARNIDADFVHHGNPERIDLTATPAGRRDRDALAEQFAKQAGCYRRAHRVQSAREQHGLRSRWARGRVHGSQPFPCKTQMSVNRRRAVSMSTFTLPLSRSIRMREPSLWMPRRPMSIASILSGVAVRIA